MRVCTLDSAFKCLVRDGIEMSPVPLTFIGISCELPLNLLAGLPAQGDEANAGGDECDADESVIAKSVTSLLILCA